MQILKMKNHKVILPENALRFFPRKPWPRISHSICWTEDATYCLVVGDDYVIPHLGLVDIVSINGLGEVRWKADARDTSCLEHLGAIRVADCTLLPTAQQAISEVALVYDHLEPQEQKSYRDTLSALNESGANVTSSVPPSFEFGSNIASYVNKMWTIHS